MVKSAWLVIPTYKEAENVARTLSNVFEAFKSVKDFDMSVLIVDSASPDGTGEIVKDLQKKYGEQLKLVIEPKRGLGNAYDAGFKYALENGADVVMEMDADNSHDPSKIPALLSEITNGADLVIGSRYMPGGFIPGDWPFLRIINSKVARFVARSIGGVTSEVSDPTAGYRAMKTSAIKAMQFSAAGATGYVLQVKGTDAFANAGYVIKEVPIAFSDRQFGNSKIRAKDVRQFISYCIKLRMSKVFGKQQTFAETPQVDQEPVVS